MLDPTGVGFAFGGVTPGWLHSKGQLHEQHEVAFSVDRVGRYLLHVRLRQACRPLPGSPFALLVHAAAAHQTTSFVAPSEQPLVGEVGLAAGDGCSYTLQTYDRVGNKCTEGGSEVVAACSDCNLIKGNQLPEVCGMIPALAPVEPTNHRLQSNGRSFPPNFLHESWRDFLYWDSELEQG